jgi:hypothetical protein
MPAGQGIFRVVTAATLWQKISAQGVKGSARVVAEWSTRHRQALLAYPNPSKII